MTAPQSDLEARLVMSEKPADVVDAAAARLAQLLGGFVWVKSRQSLDRRTDGRRVAMSLSKSKHNRTGQVRFSVLSLAVFDDGLRAWRRANAALTVERPASVESIVCTSNFPSRKNFVILAHADQRVASLERFAARLRLTALPWFARFADPGKVASAVPDALLGPWGFAQDLMELLVSGGHDAQARALWERVRELNPNHRQALTSGRELARSGDRPRWHTPEAIGWSAAVLGL